MIDNITEFICDKCNGKGSTLSWVDRDRDRYEITCSKCLGKGKLDWIENIVGKRKPEVRKLKANWKIDHEEDLQSVFGLDTQAELYQSAAQEIADAIDANILDMILKKGNK